MKALARALINAAIYLDLGGEQGVDGDSALQALEEIAYQLSHCDEAEKKAVAEVLAEMRAAELENGPRQEVLEFLDNFPVSFGLTDEADLPEPEAPSRINLL